QVSVDRVGARLLDERLHGAVVREAYEAIRGRIGHADEGERGDRPGALVLDDLPVEWDVREDVAVEHQEALVEHRLGELERTRGPARVRLLDEAQAPPRRGAAPGH